MAENRQTFQRAINAALAGGVVNLVIAGVLVILAHWLASTTLVAAAWYAFGGLGLWIILAVVYQQHKLERLEAMEAEALAARGEQEAGIFQSADQELSMARRRLDRLYKWGLPIVSALTGLYLIAVGLWRFNVNRPLLEARDTLGDSLRIDPLLLDLVGEKIIDTTADGFVGQGAVVLFMVGIFFTAFVIGRWIAGMARQGAWSMLRGGAAYLAGVALVAALLAVGHGLLYAQYTWLLKYLAVGIPLFMVVTGAEMLINLLLNVYRPRKPGEMPRPAFDSRLLSLLSTPGSIARAVSESINYQFGFEITRSWFWQLVGRTLGWLVLLGIAILLAVSSLVIVEPEENALVTRFGRLNPEPLGPGLHFKLPWPIERVQHLDVGRVHEIHIGSAEAQSDRPILWTNEHYDREPVHLLVAMGEPVEEGAADEAERDLSVALINVELTITYRIADPVRYVRQSTDPVNRLRTFGESEMSRLLLREDIDAWVGPRRRRMGEQLERALRAYIEQADLGLALLNVQVTSMHPPQPVAEAFHETLKADQERQAAIENARADAIRELASVAGSVDRAERIIAEIDRLRAISAEQRAEDLPEREALDPEVEARMLAEQGGDPAAQRQQAEIERLLLEAGGQAAGALANARAQRWQFENQKRGEVAIYRQQLEAARQAPEYFRMRNYLIALTEGLQGTRKYLLLSDPQQRQIRLDLQPLDTGFGATFNQDN